MAQQAATMLLDGLVFPEAPRWHAGRLWFSDIHAHEVVAVDLDGRRESVVSVPQRPSGLGWLPDGRLLVVSMGDRKLLRLDASGDAPGDASGLAEAADLSGLAAFDCNDMVVDAQGRAYIGHFGFDFFGSGDERANASLILVTPDGDARVAADDLAFPNGVVITPDGETLIVAESMATRLTAFDVDADGSLSNRRVWAQLDGPPDGICLDAEGCVWVSIPMRPGRFIRVAEGGAVHDQFDVDGRLAIACMLGGADRRTLFMIEASESDAARIEGPGNGRIRAAEVDVPGAGFP